MFYEILYLNDYVDEFTIQALNEYEGKKFANVASEDVSLDSPEEKEELDKILLCVNTDVAGPVLGRDSVCVIGEVEAVNMINSFAKEIGYSVRVAQSIYSSDGIPFADLGIPAINFMRFGVPGSAYIHNRHDTLSFMSAKSLEKTGQFVQRVCDKIIASHVMPINRVIPQNMVDEVNKYLKKQSKKAN